MVWEEQQTSECLERNSGRPDQEETSQEPVPLVERRNGSGGRRRRRRRRWAGSRWRPMGSWAASVWRLVVWVQVVVRMAAPCFFLAQELLPPLLATLSSAPLASPPRRSSPHSATRRMG